MGNKTLRDDALSNRREEVVGKCIDVLGFGSPVLDLLVEVEDYFLEQLELKKGTMTLTDEDRAEEILEQLSNYDIKECAGGSVGNTVYGVASLGGKSAFCGVIGDDKYGKTYELSFEKEDMYNKLVKVKGRSAHAITFITKDKQRTFSTHLGAAIHFKPHHVIEDDIKHSKVLHIEAYQVELENSYKAILLACDFAKKYSTMVSFDLSDGSLIQRERERIDFILRNYVDIVFANEEEAKEFTGKSPRDALNVLSDSCKYAIVKLGGRGSLVKHNDNVLEIKADSVNAVDTTGAGDMYAAGFLYGITNGKSLEESARIGSKYAARVVTQIGARLK